MLTQCPWAAETACLRRRLLQKVKASGIQQITWKSQGGTRILCPLVLNGQRKHSVQRKVLYLPPLPHFAYEMIFLLVHSEGVGFRYLFQLWRLSEMNACVKKRTLCVQSSRDSTTIVLSLFGFFPDSNVTLGRTPELGQRPGRTSIRI